MSVNSIGIIADLIRLGKYIFSSEDIRKLYNLNVQQASRILRKLEEANAIRRIHRGLFILDRRFLTGVPNEVIFASLMGDKKYYLGLYTALKFWRLIDFVLAEHFILTPERLPRTEYEIENYKVRIIKIKKRMFFGFVRVPINAHFVNISDTEKTILDSMYFQEYVRVRDVIQAVCRYREKLDIRKLVEYATRFNKSSLIQRIGFVLERLSMAKEDELSELSKYVSKRYYWLDVKGPKIEIERDERWRILANVKVECS